MIVIVSMILGGLVVAVVFVVALLGWGGKVGRTQRYALCTIAAGLAWAGPARALGMAPGPGDLLFLSGLLAYLLATYGPPIFRHMDSLDGRADGRISFPPRH